MAILERFICETTVGCNDTSRPKDLGLLPNTFARVPSASAESLFTGYLFDVFVNIAWCHSGQSSVAEALVGQRNLTSTERLRNQSTNAS